MKEKLLLGVFLIFLQIGFAYAQDRRISGQVTSAGVPLPGVTVIVPGSTISTQTNENGNYSLIVQSGTPSLTFRLLGFVDREISIGSSDVIDVVLTSGQTELSEVVVTGYGTVQKKKFAGATSSIGGTDISRQPFGSFDQGLQGMAPGVSVLASSGQPGANAVVRIRGNGSINGSNVPLYILDGIEISAADFATINQSDFENLEILKDAVSTGIYGSRGANGVIVITTKKGSAGQLKFDYRAQYGISDFPKDRLETMNSVQKVDYELQRGNPYGWSPAQADSLRDVDFNWRDALFQTGQTHEHTINASGGSETSTFFGSLSYFNQEGVVQTTGLERYNARVNVDSKIKNWRFGLNLNGGFSDRSTTAESNTSISSPLNAARWSNPYETDVVAETGDWNHDGVGYLTSGQPNGAMQLFLNYNWRKQIKGIATSYVEYHFPFLDGLYARTNWGIDYTQNELATYNDPQNAGQQARDGSLNRQFNRNFRYTGTTSLHYATVIEEDHDISAALYHEVVKNDYRQFGFTGYGFTNGFTNETGITAGSASNPNYIPVLSGTGWQTGIMSFFATVNYGYKGKYYLNLVGRRDGSSRLGINNRYANFGSVGLTWSISDEQFIKDVDFINNLQLRASYGTTGNTISTTSTASDTYYPIPLFGRATYAGASGWSPSQAGNLDLGWETNRTANIGLDFALANRRISGSVDVYNRETIDQFYQIPVDPASSGFTSILGNFGTLRNRGVEFALSGDVIRNNEFRWTIGGNVTYNQNKITSLPQDSVISGVTILAEGRPVNSLFLVPYAGVNPENGNALYYTTLEDGTVDQTQVFSVQDKVIYGTSDAPWFGGITTAFAYKGFDVSALLNFFSGRVMYNNDRNNLTNPQYFFDNMSPDLLREWQNPGDITDVPRPSSSGGNAYQSQTTRFLENANYWRLRNVNIGYTFSKAALGRSGINSLRVFVNGQNWWTATKYRSFDPEMTGTSLTGAQYPALVQTTFGVTVGF